MKTARTTIAIIFFVIIVLLMLPVAAGYIAICLIESLLSSLALFFKSAESVINEAMHPALDVVDSWIDRIAGK